MTEVSVCDVLKVLRADVRDRPEFRTAAQVLAELDPDCRLEFCSVGTESLLSIYNRRLARLTPSNPLRSEVGHLLMDLHDAGTEMIPMAVVTVGGDVVGLFGTGREFSAFSVTVGRDGRVSGS